MNSQSPLPYESKNTKTPSSKDEKKPLLSEYQKKEINSNNPSTSKNTSATTPKM